MTESPDQRIDELETANQQLNDSLKACHELVAELRGKLVANFNEPPLPDNDRLADEAN